MITIIIGIVFDFLAKEKNVLFSIKFENILITQCIKNLE